MQGKNSRRRTEWTLTMWSMAISLLGGLLLSTPALAGEDRMYELIRDFIVTIVQDLVEYNAPQRTLKKEQVDKIYEALIYITGLAHKDFSAAGMSTSNSELLKKDIINFLLEQYDLYRRRFNENIIKNAEKWLVLETIDQAWRQHMLNLDHLKEGIGLRGWGQKNPLIEYKREAFDMFREMMSHIRFDIVHHIFHLNLTQFNEQEFEQRRDQELERLNLSGTGDPA